MARRALPASFDTATAYDKTEDDTKGNAEYSTQESNRSGTKSVTTMPLTEEKRLDGNFSNNNDHNYLHKKFKKVASTMPVSSPENTQIKETSTVKINTDTNTYISNGSISASHPEIEKIKSNQDYENVTVSQDAGRNVQTTVYNKFRIGEVNNFDLVTGKTSFSEEFSNKTENLDNDFIKDVQNGTGGRYVCPYCKLSCAKPSVLQKHIRAHTNERPYPCIPCGFAFKTKSNLYKHRRSRTHALRLQGTDVVVTNEEELSAGSESDTSLPPTSLSDAGSDISIIRIENSRPSEFSSPELSNDRSTPTNGAQEDSKFKTIYKPKFRAFFKESEEKIKKTFSPNADFLNEHISKIISDNEAIVDVIETPLQKKYNKIKKNAESKLLTANEIFEVKSETVPLNLSKTVKESENTFRKRAHSETFSQTDFQKHPLNPEGSIIKDLLLKTKANGITTSANEVEGVGTLYICPLCQIPYRSADNLEIHRLYYCKGSVANSSKDGKSPRHDLFIRSNSINVRLPESSNSITKVSTSIKSASPRNNKPDNLVIIKPEYNDVVAPLPSPGPLLGNTRLVDTRIPPEVLRNSENYKTKPMVSPKRRIENRSETFSPRLSDNVSPSRSLETYAHAKIRCIEASNASLRSIEDLQSQMRQNSTSLQMFGGEVKIVDHSGGTTTLRIEPSKSQLSPILTHQNLSPNKLANDPELSSIVVRSGLHSGGTIVHTPKAQTPRITISAAPNMSCAGIPHQDVPHFQFPPFNVITAYNPLTLPPLSPSSTTPNGASSIFHGGKLIPHVPGMPGPNTPTLYVGTPNMQTKNMNNCQDVQVSPVESSADRKHGNLASIYTQTKGSNNAKYEYIRNVRSPNSRQSRFETDKSNTPNSQNQDKKSPFVRTKPIEELSAAPRSTTLTNVRSYNIRSEGVSLKRNSDGMPRPQTIKETLTSYVSPNKTKISEARQNLVSKSIDKRVSDSEIRNFNFETLITKAEIYNNQIISSSDVQRNTNVEDEMNLSQNERSETSYFQKNCNVKDSEDRKPKFLRPSTLPLKPGTFTPKRHHGITPNANTMPLVSPETPRPAKAYGQLYLNGNAYTYLGLKCSTKVFYCTINRPQPTYVPNQHFLSMYSNWQLLSDLTPDPLGLSASSAMSLYDSRHRPQTTVIAKMNTDLILTHSSLSNKYSKITLATGEKKSDENSSQSECSVSKKELAGGFESNEEYTYIRGRGRGRYVCSECGIRCKKPSMLKKHIRTHTDVRPYTCTHCAFSFKTKGNLTKHMKSKAHYKKCCELGINPNEGTDMDGGEGAQCSGETDDESDSDGDEGNEGETESSDTEVGKSRLPEHEAAHCLLSLGGARAGAGAGAAPGLLTSARPSTYPYSPVQPEGPDRDTPALDSRTDTENEPMDLSRTELKPPTIPEIPTAGESSVLASLASNTAKLPQQQTHWSNGEPMLHAYLTERALLDSKIKQSQQLSSLSKLRKNDLDKTVFTEARNGKMGHSLITTECDTGMISAAKVKVETSVSSDISDFRITKKNVSNEETLALPTTVGSDSSSTSDNKKNRTEGNAENAKFVVSEYLKIARVSSSNENLPNQLDSPSESTKTISVLALANSEELMSAHQEATGKLPGIDHDPVARKVVIGAGGVAFKVTKGKEFDNAASYSPGRLMEDGRRECDFCNKTFTKPSQLRLHLNIHYMERPFRCSACAVSFRTRGHLQKHERSGSHHNKVSMTSTFGAATSQNPRPFRCSDCNIAFRIHGHLAKHLRSKMHVMRLECLFKLPFGTFTEIERAGVSLTDIDTTDCASSLASLQLLARALHDKDPSRLEYREPPPPPRSPAPAPAAPDDDDDDAASETSENKDARVVNSATDN